MNHLEVQRIGLIGLMVWVVSIGGASYGIRTDEIVADGPRSPIHPKSQPVSLDPGYSRVGDLGGFFAEHSALGRTCCLGDSFWSGL